MQRSYVFQNVLVDKLGLYQALYHFVNAAVQYIAKLT